jgi:hypothetical protein
VQRAGQPANIRITHSGFQNGQRILTLGAAQDATYFVLLSNRSTRTAMVQLGLSLPPGLSVHTVIRFDPTVVRTLRCRQAASGLSQCPVGELQPGGSTEVQLTIRASQSTQAGTRTSFVVAVGEDLPTPHYTDRVRARVAYLGSTRLVVKVTPHQPSLTVGRNIQLVMTVKNVGPNAAPGLTVSVDVSDPPVVQIAGVVITQKGAGVGKGVQLMTFGSAVWQPGDLSIGTSAQARLTLHGTFPGQTELTVTAVSTAGGSACTALAQCRSTRVTPIRVRG